jgi:hypothetical protein
MNVSENSLRVSSKVIRLVGYGLLVLWLFDIAALFVPPRFMNPAWEFETMGRLVESVGWALVAFAMIFFGEDSYRLRLELPLLRVLSWLCLIFAILYFAMLPLGLANTWRIRNNNDVEIGNQISQRTAPIEEVQAKLSSNLSDAELLQVYKKLVPPNTPLDIKSPRETKEKLLAELDASRTKIKGDLDAARSSNFKQLVKSSVKWNIGTVICAVLFLYLWRFSRFYRVLKSRSQES